MFRFCMEKFTIYSISHFQNIVRRKLEFKINMHCAVRL